MKKSSVFNFGYVFFLLVMLLIPLNVKADLVKTCTYNVQSVCFGCVTGGTINLSIYDNGALTSYITSLGGKDEDISLKIMNLSQGGELYTNLAEKKKCPNYGVLMYRTDFFTNYREAWFSDTETGIVIKDTSYGYRGISTEYTLPKKDSDSYYKTVVEYTKMLNSYKDFSIDNCKDDTKVITRISKCKTDYESSKMMMNNEKTTVDNWVRQGYVSNDDQRTKDFYTAYNSDQTKWDEVSKELDAEQDKIDQEMADAADDYTPDETAPDTDGTDTADCGILGEDFLDYLKDAFNLIQVIGAILALVFSMVDMLKAVASGEEDAKKKAFSNTGKRLTAAVLLYMIPAILTLLFSIINKFTGSTCGIG